VIRAFLSWFRDDWALEREREKHQKRIEAMKTRQLNYGEDMRKGGTSILNATKVYKPVLTKQQPVPAPKANKVIPIRRKA
jgi:hypothetical protein